MKRLTIAAIAIAGLLMVGCQEEPPEPEVSGNDVPGNYEQPTSPAPYASNESSAVRSQELTVDDVEKIPLNELLRLKEAGEVTIIDVRGAQYYVESHIPGSINIPANQTAAMIDMLPKGKKIVTYCT